MMCGTFQVFIFKKIIRHCNLFNLHSETLPRVTKSFSSKLISFNCVNTSSILTMIFTNLRLGVVLFRSCVLSHWTRLQIKEIEINSRLAASYILANEIKNFFFFDWDSLHARLNSHYKAWSYKKKKHKKIKAYRKSL